jgi:hypothetical protein
MGKMVLPLYLFTFLPLSMMAQDDDMYFVPTKENVAKEARKYGMPQNVYYSGSNRSVDDYNRRVQFSSPVDSTGNDIIDFSAVRGVYPDSAYSQPVENDDYALTRRMSRFDDYTPSEAYWDGYRAGRWSSPWYNTWYSWYDPWYYDSWWYWNDPFYYSSWYGWRYPYYYSTWYSPRYYGYHYYGGSYISRGGSSRLSSNMRFYDRRNYSSDGSRRDGTGVRAGNVRVSRPNSNNASPTINSTPRTVRSSGSFGGSSSGVSRSSGSFGGGSSRPSGGGGAVRSGGVRHR